VKCIGLINTCRLTHRPFTDSDGHQTRLGKTLLKLSQGKMPTSHPKQLLLQLWC